MPDNPPHDPATLTALQKPTNPSTPALTTETLSPHTINIPHYGLNHPKAYFGYTLALAHATPTTPDPQTLTETYVIGTPAKARTGAINLGLVTTENGTPNTDRLTTTGQRAKEHAIDTYGSVLNALDAFNDLRGTSTRFTQIADWHTLTPHLIENDPATERFTSLLQTIHSERNDPPGTGIPLPELVHELYYEDPAFTVELLIRDDVQTRNQLDDLGTFNHELLQHASTYRGAGVYQFKNLLYHLGALTTRGADTTNLSPPTEIWALEPDYRGNA